MCHNIFDISQTEETQTKRQKYKSSQPKCLRQIFCYSYKLIHSAFSITWNIFMIVNIFLEIYLLNEVFTSSLKSRMLLHLFVPWTEQIMQNFTCFLYSANWMNNFQRLMKQLEFIIWKSSLLCGHFVKTDITFMSEWFHTNDRMKILISAAWFLNVGAIHSKVYAE